MKTQFTCNIYAQTLLSVWEAYIVGKGILTKVQECGFNEVQSMKMVCMRMSFSVTKISLCFFQYSSN